jgi:hypothetical protein
MRNEDICMIRSRAKRNISYHHKLCTSEARLAQW